MAQLEPGNHHAGAGDGADDADQRHGNPRAQLNELAKDTHGHGAQGAQSHANRSDRTHVRLAWCGAGGKFLGCGGQLGGTVAQTGVDQIVFGGGVLGDLLLNHAQELFVRREEGLTDAGGVVYELDDGGIPVIARAVVEHTVAAHEQKVHIACGKGCDDGFLLAFAPAFAVSQIGLGHGRQCRVGCGVRNFHRQITAAAIQKQRPGLKRRTFAAVKAREGHKVVQQLQQIALQANQLFQLHGLNTVLFFGIVMVQQRQQLGLDAAGQKGLHVHLGQAAQRRGGTCGQPFLTLCQRALELIPLRLCQLAQRLAKHRLHSLLAQGLQSGGPGRVHALHQWQTALARHSGQGQCGNTVRAIAEHLRTQRQIAFFRGVERSLSTGVKLHQTRAGEKVIHLGLHGVHGFCRSQRLRTRLEVTAQLCSLCKPGLQRTHIGKKCFSAAAVNAGHTVATIHAAVNFLNTGDQRGQRFIAFGGGGRDHAIAIEAQRLQRCQALLHLGQRNGAGLALPRQHQHTTGLGQQQRTFFARIVDAGQLQHITAIGQHLRVLDAGHRPFTGCHQLGRANASILADINQIQRRAIKFNPSGRAGQRHPELLIQLTNVGNVLTGPDDDLIHIARPEKLPLVTLLHETSNSRGSVCPLRYQKMRV